MPQPGTVERGARPSAEIRQETALGQSGEDRGRSERDPAVIATILGSFLVRIGGAATGVMLGLLLAHLHREGMRDASALAMGGLTAAFYLAELVGAPICGVLADRRGVRALLLAGPFLGVFAELLFAGSAQLSFLAGARLLQGLTTAATIPAALALLSQATEGQTGGRGRVMGLFEVGSIGGLAAGYVAGGFLWSALHRQGFTTLASFYALAVALFVFIKIERSRPIARPPRASWQAIRASADLVPSWLAVTAAAGLWFGHAAYQFSGGSPRLHQLLTRGMPDRTIGVVFGVYVLLFALGTVGWGWLLGRVSIRRAMRIGVLGLLVAAVALYAINHAGRYGGTWFDLALVAGIVSLAAEAAYTPAALVLLAARSDADRHGRGALMGVYSMLLAGGQLIGALLGGVFALAWGVDGLIFATVLLAMIAALTLPSEATYTEERSSGLTGSFSPLAR